MKKFRSVGEYSVIIFYDSEGKITDITCSCRHGTIHRDHWKTGQELCHHIKEVAKTEGNFKKEKN